MRPSLLSLFKCILMFAALCPACSASNAHPDDMTLPPAGVCEFHDLTALVPAPISAEAFQVGGFTIAMDALGNLVVTHESAPEVVLLASAINQPFLAAAASELLVEEHQGSFEVAENIEHACGSGSFAVTRSGHDKLLVNGSFKESREGCDELEFSLGFCQPQVGHLRFVLTVSDPNYNVVTMRLASSKTEHIFGLGEQFPHQSLNLKGRVIPVLVQEGGVGRGHDVITPAMEIVSPGAGGNQNTTYYATPTYLTNTGQSLLLENSDYSVFDFTDDHNTEIRVFASAVTGRVFAGTTPLEQLERLTEYTGRMPALPEWVNQGAIVALARPLEQSSAIVQDLLYHDAAVAAIWNQTWSGVSKTFIGEQVLWNWVQNPHYHPGWDNYVAELAALDIRVMCYINPMFRDLPEDAGEVKNLFQEGLENGHYVRNQAGDSYLLEITAFEVGMLDLTNPKAVAWMKDIIKIEMMQNAGCSGWMADFAEALPFDAVLHSGISAAAYHNLYPVEWARLNREVVEETGTLGEVLFFNRSGHTQSPGAALLFWEGDQLTTWDHYDGLQSALLGLVGSGFSGIALNHSDTGGYTSLTMMGSAYGRSPELLKRWTEMNAFTAVLRTHEGNQPKQGAQVYSDDEAMSHFARFSRVYRELAGYRAQLFQEAESKGWPVVRHLAMHYPDDPQAWDIHDQFLLGREFLIAPIVEPCQDECEREVYLPEGQWTQLWSGAEFDAQAGGMSVTVPAPLGSPPVFYLSEGSAGPGLAAALTANGDL